MGVRDIGEVSGDAWRSRDTASDDDGREVGRERDKGMDVVLGVMECDAAAEPSGDSISADDDTRGDHEACGVHWRSSGGAHGMRGDRVGVRDISEVPGDAWSLGDTASGDDGRGLGRELHAGMDGGLRIVERNATAEPSGDRVCIVDNTRGEYGACDIHWSGSGEVHRM